MNKVLVFILGLVLCSLEAVAGTIAQTPIEKLNVRIRQQRLQIERDAKLGKLTKDQTESLKVQLETIHKTELADLKAKSSKTLTDAQITDLNNQLNTLSKSIPIK